MHYTLEYHFKNESNHEVALKAANLMPGGGALRTALQVWFNVRATRSCGRRGTGTRPAMMRRTFEAASAARWTGLAAPTKRAGALTHEILTPPTFNDYAAADSEWTFYHDACALTVDVFVAGNALDLSQVLLRGDRVRVQR